MIFFFALLFSDHLYAQSTITGTVSDNTGAPVNGVSVTVKAVPLEPPLLITGVSPLQLPKKTSLLFQQLVLPQRKL